MSSSAEVDERTLREIYFPAFETAVRQEQPWTVMCSYNRINGVFASENPWLLTQVLRDEWGFEGCVVSDWGAVSDRVAGLAAGDRVRTFFGDVRFQDETIFIICDDDKLTRKLGEDHGTVILYFPSETYYICISDEYLELDILAHEITHAELHTRLSAEAQKRIPTWFDEGIALQNDYREKYSEAQWITQTDNGKNAVALEDMDTPAEFYAGKAEDRRFRYLNAKHELDVWMTTHGQHGLLELLDRLNGGADFTTAYEG